MIGLPRVGGRAALLAAVLGCGGPDRNPVTAAFAERPASRLRSAPVVFRIPGERGGSVHVYQLPRLNEVSFRFDAPGLTASRVTGYSEEDGQIYLVSARQALIALDLATGRARMVDSTVATVTTMPSGAPIIIRDDGAVAAVDHRVAVNWPGRLPAEPAAILGAGRGLLLAEIRDNGKRELISAASGRPVFRQSLPDGPAATSLWGDLVVVGTDSGLVLLDPAKVQPPRRVALSARPAAVALSPSGHRILAIQSTQLVVVDRFSATVLFDLELPGAGRDLRTDPLGRLVLIQPPQGDSIWVVNAGTRQHVATIRGSWGQDLPTVAPDGTVLTRQGGDLIALAADSLTPVGRVRGLTSDRWLAVAWDPRRPTVNLADQAVAPAPETGEKLYVQVSFSLNEAWAQDNADNLRRAGLSAVVLPPATPDDGFRVVLGPYPTRESAEDAGRKLGRPFFVFSRGEPTAQ